MSTTRIDPITFKSSELNRSSSTVFAAAQEHPVIVTRRDGEPLVLMTQVAAQAQQDLLELAAQLIAVTTDDEGALDERMAAHFPWMYALAADDRAQCAIDLVNAARASFSTGQAHLAIAELTAWRETAVLLAAGVDAGSADWIDGEEQVPRP